MIRFVLAKDIDRIKYDRCIENSIGHRIYAYSWYLDCVCDRWDVIIKGDYEIVMPLPNKKKYGISYIYMPPWTQQLGLFSPSIVDEDMIRGFIAGIPGRIQWIDYQFNAANTISGTDVSSRKNYLLSLEDELDEIALGFNKNRKRSIKNGFQDCLLDKQGDATVFLKNYKTIHTSYSVSDEAFEQLVKLCCLDNDQVNVWNVFLRDEFIAGLIWLKDTKRITYLVPFANEKAKKLDIPSLMVYELIKECQKRKMDLDFEGSMLPGVENFYRSFGASPEFYSYFRKRPFG